MEPLKKYGDPSDGYDFSKARTAREKTEAISIWIGEILYEALAYKDYATVSSLIEAIQAEIEELIGHRKDIYKQK